MDEHDLSQQRKHAFGIGGDRRRRGGSEPDYSVRADRIFQALSDPTRRAILRKLASNDAPIHQVASGFEQTLPTMYKHLRVLRKAGLVTCHSHGGRLLCVLDQDALCAAQAWFVGLMRPADVPGP